MVGRQHATAVAVVRTPGRGRSYLRVGTPRLPPFNVCRGGREDIRRAARPGYGRFAHAGAGDKLPSDWDTRLQPVRAHRGGREDTRQAARPGCGRSANTGAREKLPSYWHAPAAAALCVPGPEGGH